MKDLCCAHNNKEFRRKGVDYIFIYDEEGSQVVKVSNLCSSYEEVNDSGVGTPIPPTLTNVLDKFIDQMPNSLPKVLSPRHIVGHHIEIQLRLQPLARL
jgi:hypothetical protein